MYVHQVWHAICNMCCLCICGCRTMEMRVFFLLLLVVHWSSTLWAKILNYIRKFAILNVHLAYDFIYSFIFVCIPESHTRNGIQLHVSPYKWLIALLSLCCYYGCIVYFQHCAEWWCLVTKRTMTELNECKKRLENKNMQKMSQLLVLSVFLSFSRISFSTQLVRDEQELFGKVIAWKHLDYVNCSPNTNAYKSWWWNTAKIAIFTCFIALGREL